MENRINYSKEKGKLAKYLNKKIKVNNLNIKVQFKLEID